MYVCTRQFDTLQRGKEGGLKYCRDKNARHAPYLGRGDMQSLMCGPGSDELRLLIGRREKRREKINNGMENETKEHKKKKGFAP